ncbi:hypothetical protein LguiA_023018 [Lonicera macranthoides]
MGFHLFYETWFDQLHHLVHQLTKAPKPPTTQEHHDHYRQLVHKAMSHFSEYYRVKALAAKQDVLSIIVAPWCTTLERSLHWIAGWRPTTAFHLVYTESSIRFESHIVDILRGLRTGDLGDLSPAQFSRDGASDLTGKCADIDEKLEGLVKIVEKADDLRLRTVRRVVDLLTPQQAIEFLIAAAQLQFGIRGWGLDHDRRR